MGSAAHASCEDVWLGFRPGPWPKLASPLAGAGWAGVSLGGSRSSLAKGMLLCFGLSRAEPPGKAWPPLS